MTVYRPRLVGLPLQQSLFREIGHGPAILGLTGIFPGDRYGVNVDETGDLHLDRAEVDRMGAALLERATPEMLDQMRRRLEEACAAVSRETDLAAALRPDVPVEAVRERLSRLGGSLADLLPYGILSKFVPDTLLQVLERAGDRRDPPFPTQSPGAELTLRLIALGRDCASGGVTAAAWPAVPVDLWRRVTGFCREETGWGPLPWDAPGYEDPGYVLGLLGGIGPERVPDAVLGRLTTINRASRPDRLRDSPARSALAAWLTFLEWETWYIRRAFYFGMRPLLLRLLPWYQRMDPGMTSSDLLFLRLEELVAPPGAIPPFGARRARLLGDAEYLAKYPVTTERLQRMMDTA